MENFKRKKHTLSDEQKQKIKELKEIFSAKGIPRELWSSYIQQELMLQNRSKKVVTRIEKVTDSVGPFKRLKYKILGMFGRLASKRFTKVNESLGGMFDAPYGEPSEDEMETINAMFSDLPLKDVEKLVNRGTFIVDRPDKKSRIVDLDEDEEKK